MDTVPAQVGRKAALRRQLLDRRAALDPAVRERAATGLLDALRPLLAGARTVAAYASVGLEPATGPLLAELAGPGGPDRVLLPRLLPDGDLDWVRWTGTLRAGPRGTREPPGAPLGVAAVADCDLIIVPALAVDRRGVRLGRGGGSYDRALRRAPGGAQGGALGGALGRGLVIALLHDGELLDELPEDPHDVRVPAVATPGTGLLWLSGSMGP